MNFETLEEQWAEDLSLRMRFIDDEQAAKCYFRGQNDAVRKAGRLHSSVFEKGIAIKKQCMVSLPRPEIIKAACIVDPADDSPLPDEEVLSHIMRSRFDKTSLGTVTLYAASRRTRRIMGGPELSGDFPGRFDQINHDLIVVDAAILMKHERPECFERLRNEDVIAPFYRNCNGNRHDKLPDLIVCDDDYRTPSIVLDSLGCYGAKLIRSLLTRWCLNDNPTRLEMY